MPQTIPAPFGGAGVALVAPETFVYRPGGVAEGNVFTSFAALYLALTAAPGRRVLVLDDSIMSPLTIPDGVYDFANTKITDSAFKYNSELSVAQTQLVKADFGTAVTFTNPPDVIEGLFLTLPVGGATVMSLTTPKDVTINRCRIRTLSANKIFAISAAASGTRFVLRDTFVESGFVDLTGAVVLNVLMKEDSTVSGSSIADDGSATLSTILSDPSSSMGTQSVNSQVQGIVAGASKVTADPGPMTNVTSLDVQGALEDLDGAVSGAGAQDLESVLGEGNTSGASDIIMAGLQRVRGAHGIAGVGGALNLNGGDGAGGDFDGGDINLTPGSGAGTGSDGQVAVNGILTAQEVFAGDFHLKALDDSAHWTFIEQPDHIRIVNRKTNKTYRLVLQEEP